MIEYGTHAIYPGRNGMASGYIIGKVRPDAHAFIHWEVKETSIPGSDGKPTPLDYGVWPSLEELARLKELKVPGQCVLRL